MAIDKVCFTESSMRQDTAPTCLKAGSPFCRGAAQADFFAKYPLKTRRKRAFLSPVFLFQRVPAPAIYQKTAKKQRKTANETPLPKQGQINSFFYPFFIRQSTAQYPYFFLFARIKITDKPAAANSATITDAQIPSTPNANGNSKTAPI